MKYILRFLLVIFLFLVGCSGQAEQIAKKAANPAGDTIATVQGQIHEACTKLNTIEVPASCTQSFTTLQSAQQALEQLTQSQSMLMISFDDMPALSKIINEENIRRIEFVNEAQEVIYQGDYFFAHDGGEHDLMEAARSDGMPVDVIVGPGYTGQVVEYCGNHPGTACFGFDTEDLEIASYETNQEFNFTKPEEVGSIGFLVETQAEVIDFHNVRHISIPFLDPDKDEVYEHIAEGTSPGTTIAIAFETKWTSEAEVNKIEKIFQEAGYTTEQQRPQFQEQLKDTLGFSHTDYWMDDAKPIVITGQKN